VRPNKLLKVINLIYEVVSAGAPLMHAPKTPYTGRGEAEVENRGRE